MSKVAFFPPHDRPRTWQIFLAATLFDIRWQTCPRKAVGMAPRDCPPQSLGAMPTALRGHVCCHTNLPHTRRLTYLLAPLLLALTAVPSFAAAYGDVTVTVDDEPQQKSAHGYAEIWFRIDNRSETATREVKVNLPKYSYSYSGDYLRSVSRTVTVKPKELRPRLPVLPRETVAGRVGDRREHRWLRAG